MSFSFCIDLITKFRKAQLYYMHRGMTSSPGSYQHNFIEVERIYSDSFMSASTSFQKMSASSSSHPTKVGISFRSTTACASNLDGLFTSSRLCCAVLLKLCQFDLFLDSDRAVRITVSNQILKVSALHVYMCADREICTALASTEQNEAWILALPSLCFVVGNFLLLFLQKKCTTFPEKKKKNRCRTTTGSV